MDFITQNLLGGIAGQASCTRALGRRALWPAMLGGALPDFDFLLAGLADPALPYEWHRYVTHAIVLVPPLGLLAAAPFLLFRAFRSETKQTILAATIGCATHGLLDALTSYGTHLWWPFMSGRVAWDSMSIIDPIFTGVLLVGVIATLIAGRARPAILAFALSLAYIGFGVAQHERASAVQGDLARSRGHEIMHARVLPTLGNLMLFRSVYRTADDRVYADAIRVGLFREARVREGASAQRATLETLPPRRDDARMREVFTKFSRFADGFTVAERLADGSTLIGDARHSMDPADFMSLWGLRIPETDAEPVTWSEHFGGGSVSLQAMINELVAPDARYRAFD